MKTLSSALNLPEHEYSGVIGNCMYCNNHIPYSKLQLEQMEGWNKILATRNEELFTPGNFQPCDSCHARSEARQRMRDTDWNDYLTSMRTAIKAGMMTPDDVGRAHRSASPADQQRYAQDWDDLFAIFRRKAKDGK